MAIQATFLPGPAAVIGAQQTVAGSRIDETWVARNGRQASDLVLGGRLTHHPGTIGTLFGSGHSPVKCGQEYSVLCLHGSSPYLIAAPASWLDIGAITDVASIA